MRVSGLAVVAGLLGAGRQVVGLARSDSSAAAVQAARAEVHRGDLDDLDSLSEAAAADRSSGSCRAEHISAGPEEALACPHR